MQPSCLSRNVLYISGPCSSGTLWVMTKEGSIWPSSIRRSRSSVQRLHVGLAGADRQALVHDHAHRELVDQPADRRRAPRASRPAGRHRPSRAARAAGRSPASPPASRGRRSSRAWTVTCASMPTASMHFSGPLPPVSSFRRSTTLSSSKLIVMAPPASAMVRRSGTLVDGDDLLRAEQDRAADRHLPDRAAAPDRHRVVRLDVALHRRLPAGRQDVAEEQDLLVGEAVAAP